ncbi:MAG: hypothetical protein GY780_12350 [bacterium]|nr:hypothetical protein [bacterium]
MMTNKKNLLLSALALLLCAGLFLTGCESDTVAPHDDTPELTSEDAAYQAAAMGAASGRFLPQIVEFGLVNKDAYSYDFPAQGSDITGTIYFDFRTGGADGTPAAYDVANWGQMNTADGSPLSFAVGIGGSIEVAFVIMADLDQESDTATILEGSGGTFTAGAYTASFSFTDLVVTAGEAYPGSGSMTFTTSGFVLTVTFDGDHTAIVALDGTDMWVVDLDDGSLTELS